MLRGDEKSKFDPWVYQARPFQEAVGVSVAGGGSAETSSWSSVPSRVSAFRREGLRQGWVQRRVVRLIKGQAYHGTDCNSMACLFCQNEG